MAWAKLKVAEGASFTCSFEGTIDNDGGSGCGSNGHPKERTAQCQKSGQFKIIISSKEPENYKSC